MWCGENSLGRTSWSIREQLRLISSTIFASEQKHATISPSHKISWLPLGERDPSAKQTQPQFCLLRDDLLVEPGPQEFVPS